MINHLEVYYDKQPEPNRGCLLALRKIILDQDPHITETQKWGMPCFCYGKKPCLYLWVDKKTKEPYILVVEGKLIRHPLLEEGDRAKMKIFRVNPNEDLPLESIYELLNEVLAICRAR
ncbi:MAG: DUF1801 domain-containing protein [Cyclobacteriaceae bacterium]